MDKAAEALSTLKPVFAMLEDVIVSEESFVCKLRAPSLQDFLLELASLAWLDDYFYCAIQMDHY